MIKKTRNHFNGLKKVEVFWIDSCASNGWGTKDHHLKDFTFSECRTCGYVIEDVKTHITIAQSMSDSTKNMSDVISIPRVAIEKIKVLK